MATYTPRILERANRYLIRTGKGVLKRAGYDMIRLRNKPASTLLGLKRLPIDSVVDVGANLGQFARTARSFFPDARLVCFEPLPAPFDELQAWALGEAGVEAINVAIGDREGTVAFHEHVDATPGSSVLDATSEQQSRYPQSRKQAVQEVRLTTLDRAVAALDRPLGGQVLVKVDVQGYEEQVIAGGQRVLAGASACILEVINDRMYEGQATFAGIFAAMTELGFVYHGNLDQQYGEDGRVMWFDAVFLKA